MGMFRYNGSLARRLEGAEELIVRSARYRQKIGAPSSIAAKEKVYLTELDDLIAMVANGTLKAKRPCAIIGPMRHSYVPIGGGAKPILGCNGAIWVVFADNAECPKDHKLSCLDFIDWTSEVADQIAENVGEDVGADDFTLWPFRSIEMLFEPFRQDFADRASDDFWLVGYALVDSINGGGA